MVVSVDKAKAIHAGVGDTLPVEFANGSHVDATIVGLFDDQTVLTEDYLLDTSVLADAGIDPTAEWLAVSIADGASPAARRRARRPSVRRVSVRIGRNCRRSSASGSQGKIDKVLTMVNVMVALAVIIALIGIANTLALSVFERTRELGLVRAVGMTRRQLRRMVRFEAALVATFGATLGVGLGLLFGSGVVVGAARRRSPRGSRSRSSRSSSWCWSPPAAGVAAAWLPARRAGRLDVLDAIAL